MNLSSSKTSSLIKRLIDAEGSSSIGLVIFSMMVALLVILPLIIGIMEFHYFEIHKNQIKVATEVAMYTLKESASDLVLCEKKLEFELFKVEEIQSLLKKALEELQCEVEPENLSLDFMESNRILVSFDYIYHFKFINGQKSMQLIAKYEIPVDQ